MFNDPTESSPLAPNPGYPERGGAVYERSTAANRAGTEGPLRFQEGLGTDTDIPHDFVLGASQGYQSAPTGPNHNLNVWIKSPQETLKQRAHAGSAAWVEAPTFLSEFANSAYSDAHGVYERVTRDGGHQMRRNPVVVDD